MNFFRNFLVVLFLFQLISSCNGNNTVTETEVGSIYENHYSCPEVGWTIGIPRNWEILEMNRLEEMDSSGSEEIEAATGLKIDYSGLKHLITFRSEPPCLFTSTIEPFIIEYPNHWDDHQKNLMHLMYSAYTYNGIKCDSATFKYGIDDLEFNVMYFRLYSKKDEIIITQYIGTRLINGYMFCSTISYDNDDDRRILFEAVKNSQFTKLN